MSKLLFIGVMSLFSSIAFSQPAGSYTIDGTVTDAISEGYSFVSNSLKEANLFTSDGQVIFLNSIAGTTYPNSFKYGVKDGQNNITFKKIKESEKSEMSVTAVAFYQNGFLLEADVEISAKDSVLKDEEKLRILSQNLSQTFKNLTGSIKIK
ncbi:MAG: hypothetical protein JNL11_16465 [Bdellovibrionaceae bacterium]|nr:hypothetical protein [Pseudobdellovibrionaceae bacterium]